jgi:hypothetical protein
MDPHWSPDEDAHLLEMLRLKCHRAVIAQALGRTEMAVRWRIGMLKALQGSNASVTPRSSLEVHYPST